MWPQIRALIGHFIILVRESKLNIYKNSIKEDCFRGIKMWTFHMSFVNLQTVEQLLGELRSGVWGRTRNPENRNRSKLKTARLACTCEETCEAFGHPTQVSTQVQLASTYDYLPVRLARALRLKIQNDMIKLRFLTLNSAKFEYGMETRVLFPF